MLILVKSIILHFLLLSLSCNKIDLYLRDECFLKLSAKKLFNSSHLESSVSKLEAHKVIHYLVTYLSEIFVLIFMWSAITTASESLANFAVQHPSYLGAVILPVLGKSSEVCPQCFTGRRTVIVHTLNLTDSAQLH